MIPLTVDVEEMHRLREDLSMVASQVQERHRRKSTTCSAL
ncbi:MAG: hypothetical protein CM1200mP22_31740 [Dehalococcoidia bacterium]|nr:MAG: hypothetical protein CM1200mP22_31740 [Dehalococcoidia bacterium]